MHRTPFKQLRQKFANDLEDLLECPICLCQLKGPIIQCIRGHDICIECFKRLQDKKCPLCKRKYYGTNNYLAQNLVRKFDEIKTSLTNPNSSINQTTVKNKMCIGTQTSPLGLKIKSKNGVSSVVNQSNQKSAENSTKPVTRLALRTSKIYQKENKQNENKVSTGMQASTEVVQSTENRISTVKPGIGKFPCLIGNCSELLSHHILATHIKEDHAIFFVDAGIVQGNEYTKKWKIQYKPKSIFDRAIYIHNMGIFFVKIIISEEGDVHGYPVQLNHSREKVKHFKYSLSIGKSDTFISFEGKVLASRTATKCAPIGLFIPSAHAKDLMNKTRSLEYILTIKYIDKML